MSFHTSARLLFAGLTIGALLVGCGDDSEQKLQSATQGLTQAREELTELNDTLAQREEALEETRADRDLAEEAVIDARRRVSVAQQEVEKHTTDDAVFRAVQKRLLEDEGLEHVAISAQVRNGVVTLSGTVPDQQTRDLAGEVARSALGVVDVNSQITIASDAASAGD